MRQDGAREARGYNPACLPVIALLTDFGLQDHYVGAMKGAILTACPEATLVDVAPRGARPRRGRGGARARRRVPALPGGHRLRGGGGPGRRLGAPADRGGRRPLALRRAPTTASSPSCSRPTPPRASTSSRTRCSSASRSRRSSTGATSSARPPARLARGLALEEVGPVVADPVRLAQPPKTRLDAGWEGAVLHVDRFGNLTTNLLESRPRGARRRASRASRWPRGAGPAARALVLGRRGRPPVRARRLERPARDRRPPRPRRRAAGRRPRGSRPRAPPRLSVLHSPRDKLRQTRGLSLERGPLERPERGTDAHGRGVRRSTRPGRLRPLERPGLPARPRRHGAGRHAHHAEPPAGQRALRRDDAGAGDRDRVARVPAGRQARHPVRGREVLLRGLRAGRPPRRPRLHDARELPAHLRGARQGGQAHARGGGGARARRRLHPRRGVRHGARRAERQAGAPGDPRAASSTRWRPRSCPGSSAASARSRS